MSKLFKPLAFVALLFALSCGSVKSSSIHGGEEEQGEANRLPQKGMIVFGDSIAKGFAANTKLGEEISKVFYDHLMKDMGSILRGTGNIEEIISHYEDPEATAFSSQADWSVRGKLSSMNREFKHVSFAKTGAKVTADLVDQLEKAEELEDRDLDLVVFEMGSNDLCSDVSVTEFHQQYETNIRRAADLFPQARFLIIPPFNVTDVFSKVTADDVAFLTPNHRNPVRCKLFRNAINVCKGAAGSPTSAETLAKYKALNASIASIINELERDSILNNPVLAKTDDFELSKNYMAADCFHPGIDGQKELARRAWGALMNGPL